MKTRRWLLNKFKSINNERLKKHIAVIHQNTGKPRIYIFCDMVLNFLTRGSGYTDYFRGDYINLTKEQKKTFVTAKSFHNILAYLNNPEYEIVLKDKILFNKLFKKYIKREYIDLHVASLEEFKSFLKGKKVVFAKVSNWRRRT